MICSEFFELLDNYELISDEKRLEMEQHAQECESCRKELEFFHDVLKISASIPSPSAPNSLIDEVNKRLDTEHISAIKFRPDFRVLSTVAACLTIGLAVGINNGFIKDNISPADVDGIINEAVVSTESPISESDHDEVIDNAEGKIVKAKDYTSQNLITSVAQSTQQPTTAPVVSTTAPTKAPVNSTSAPSTPQPTEQTPAPTPDAQASVEKYEISETDTSLEFGYYSAGTKGRVAKPDSDYLFVQSDDMGTVVSTISEIGIKTVNGYYMTSLEEFYELINILDDKGVGYECDLQNTMSDNIAFKLTYN